MSEIIKINDMAFGGAAVGRLADGRVCFVRGAAPGEHVKVEMVRDRGRFVEAALQEVTEPSFERIVPACRYFGVCPGCSYLHIDYAAELSAKARQFTHFLTRGNLVDAAALLPPCGAPRRFGWRNKLKLALERSASGEPLAGYRGWDNRTLVPVSGCLLADDAINAAIPATLAAADGGNLASSVTWRSTGHDGVVSFYANDGKEGVILTESLPEFGDFEVGCRSFFQTNPAVASQLVARAVDAVAAAAPDELCELYCGVGVFSIAAAKRLPGIRCRGVEIDRLAIASARRNAARHGVGAVCRFEAGDAARALRGRGKGGGVAAVLVDPPRTGLDPRLVSALIAAHTKTLIYVSCGPDTLRRDLEKLVSGGYAVVSAGMFDMFPGTAHFESLSVLKWSK